MSTINRRNFLSSGASLLATAASLLMLPRASGMGPAGTEQPTGHPNALRQHPLTRGVWPMAHPHHTAEEMDRCIQLCQDCHALCTRTIKHCLERGGRHAAPELVRLLSDCAQMCAINADYMLRGSVLHERVCGVCAEACKLCADDCSQIAGDDKVLKQCVDLCRRCGESCERMASQVAA
jgi:hypothetical protein